ncbi:maleylpyruvate isomerase family mycothiol-dependent enzyme [Streptomyces telluris]|uniref:Maleylpyruvate isomerase family mycothiol-dependent enzyme n=1 Tax=Streptomyces telluris TaxID=2720021 RepID=A0A9X2LMK5_9ACTN|nr:maleylpyruvate isomerase family mycothiol-dependent enzyme [Streptomyces telluris]MCQ8772400.1 maleylpyruvate isomerase family mycothiol-dependent enzyme [Streptomyces telluris]NJP76926.1 maleylpyruvate isomerase family mycothiol-dependent enzyme [Streptomyces telluris]
MDLLPHFHREVRAFEAAARRAAAAGGAPPVPSCPGWSVSDLVVHLGSVHRGVAHIIRDRLTGPPDACDPAFSAGLPEDTADWPRPEHAPNHGPLPQSLADWFADGAAALEALFRSRAPEEPAWTWSRERTTGFWLRVQTIEAAVHRWDAENALGAPGPVDAALAAEAVDHSFEVMVPWSRTRTAAPPGSGERYRFRRTDGAGVWTVRFDGDDVRSGDGTGGQEACDVEVSGTASELMLFLWGRIPAGRLAVRGDRAVLDRYATLVPPV